MPYTLAPAQSSANLMNGNAGLLAATQNVIHVKMHQNKFQDNLLSKRLQQLNCDEMKQRLKLQRSSNELIVFLRECQKTTGYLSQMKTPSSFNQSLFESASTTNNGIIANFDQHESKSSSSSLSYDSHSIIKSNSSSLTNQRCSTGRLTQRPGTGGQRRKTTPLTSQQRPSSAAKTISVYENGSDFYPSSNTNSSTSSESSSCSRSGSFSSNSTESLRDVVKRQSNIKKYYKSKTEQKEKMLIETPKKPVFCPSTRLTLSNLDWYANTTSISNVPKPRNCATPLLASKTHVNSTDRKSVDFKSRSFNFGLNSNTKSILASRDRSPGRVSFLPLSDAKLDDGKLKKKLSFNLDESVTEAAAAAAGTRPGLKFQVSRSFIRRKQSEIVNEYSRLSAQEVMNSLRQVQQDLTAKVKLFASDSLDMDF